MSASARLALSLSMATLVTRDNPLVCTPLAETRAKAELAQKQSMVELGFARRLYVPPPRPATRIAAEDANWQEMGLANAVRITEPAAARVISLPLTNERGLSKPKRLTFPPLGDAVQRVLQPGASPGRVFKPAITPQPSSEGRALAKWLRR
eukprot:CAMPEP_0119069688 /NCGR_PEP_ID=MMETSP1178-20130426/26486_1 /TAXON_ID=33656 /ORGANISM="unid sp, Strain CCMP2000" /LENGTH=150 /DNA_ID=CAMNT_0007051473 /DNA_START=54 /DNA_END=506 /DNA_ORIENTATION=-